MKLMSLKRKYYSSCDLLPLWNFFKVNSGVTTDIKYLIVADRIDYDQIVLEGIEEQGLIAVWGKIFEEYNKLDNNMGVGNFLNDKMGILYHYAVYIQEHSLLKSLLYKTDAAYIRLLRQRGYQFKHGYKTNADYWNDLNNALKRAEHHMQHIESLNNKIKEVAGEAKKDGNPYDSIMAWVASNDIRVDENITVSRYIKVKEIINARIKAKKRNAIAA